VKVKTERRMKRGKINYNRVKYPQKRAKIKSKTMREEYTTAFYGR
jgi:hypothetical protein